jgi:hypothetical protein
MSLEDRIRAAVERRRKATNEWFLLQYDEDSPQSLGPPATAEQIARVERALGMPLPPSYAAFLRQHNGWTEWSGGAMILPADVRDAPWVSQRIKQFREHFREFFDERTLNDAFIVLLGEDEPDFVYLDKSKPTERGELEVVHTDLIHGEWGRYPDFAAFLESAANIAESRVERARRE